jgi:hypothetical protein
MPRFRENLNAIETYFLRAIKDNANFTRLIINFRVHVNQYVAYGNMLQSTVCVLQAKYKKNLQKRFKKIKSKIRMMDGETFDPYEKERQEKNFRISKRRERDKKKAAAAEKKRNEEARKASKEANRKAKTEIKKFETENKTAERIYKNKQNAIIKLRKTEEKKTEKIRKEIDKQT